MKAQKLTKETILHLATQERTFPSFAVGDCIAVSQRIKEGDKERLQVFEGDVIAIHNSGGTGTFTVRKIAANGVAVERIFPFATPMIDSITLIRQGDVRRAKLYYVRNRVGRAARIKERVITKEEKLHKTNQPAQ
jgi:large subunit ribosomal protein L19